jgi:hypothetical protein
MATNIGTLAAVISANAAPFLKSAGDVRKSAAETASSITSSLSSLPLIGGAMSGAGFVAWIHDGLKEVKEMGIEANKLGVSVGELEGLGRLSGGDQEGFAKGIGKMRKELGAIQGPASEAASAFHMIGLSGTELKNMSTVNALGETVEALGKLANADDRAYYSSKIFGKGYMAMADAIDKGKAGIEEAITEQEKLTGVISKQDVANVRQALRAIKDIEDSVSGLKRQLAVTAAPFITQLAKGFMEATKNGVDFKMIFEEVLRRAAGFVADILAGVREIRDAFKDLKADRNDIRDVLNIGGKTAASVAIPFGGVLQMFGGKGKPGAGGSPMGEAEKNLRDLEKGLKLPDALFKKEPDNGLGNVNQELQQAVAALEKQLKEQIATIGMSNEAKEMWRLAELKITPVMEKNVKAMQDQAKAGRLIDEAKSPLENFGRDMEDLNRLLGDGAITADAWAFGMKKATDELSHFAQIQETKLPEIATSGSKAAFDIIAKNEATTNRDALDIAKQALTVHKQHRDEALKQTQMLQGLKAVDLPK